MTRMTCDHPP